MSKHLFLKLNSSVFIPIDFSEPKSNWFTDGHMQEIITAIGVSFSNIYNSDSPKIVRTPRCTFSIYKTTKISKQIMFIPKNETELLPLSSSSSLFCVRVLGRSDVADKLNGFVPIDAALRIVPSIN